MVRMRAPGSWAGRSKPAKVEIYTRWSFHSFALIEVGLVGLPTLSRAGSPVGGWWLLLVSAHAVVSAVASSYALSWALGRRARPVRLMVATGVVTAVGMVASMSVFPREPNVNDAQSVAYLLVTFAGFGVGALAVAVRRVRSMLLCVLAALGIVVASGLVFRLPVGAILASLIGVLAATLALVFACGFSVWLVKSVWDLDAARELQARLAVAEERLRFGRDMHDVMGRNLAVIALKSELAEQLVRRGGTEKAAEQMAEVQRIARESQREVRAVVRGYREVDLHTELEGARGVLEAAGIGFQLALEGAGAASGATGGTVPSGGEEPSEGLAGGAGDRSGDRAAGGASGGLSGAAGGAAFDGLAGKLTPPVQSALGWVVREAATNVLRHGDARHCTVRLSVREGGEAVLVVENDGLPEQGVLVRAGSGGTPRTAGAGLAGLRERLATLGGTLDAGPVAGARFRLTARVPLPASTPTPTPTPTSSTSTSASGEAVPAVHASAAEPVAPRPVSDEVIA
ncbi:sensor histidine kinase [Streptomyces sp. NPDC058653]|uniref:sensor histidine kinase n=1 Tax=Streptomyces sp. NPDC058653 TaxID=3346576 RepID=UPI00366161F7